MPTAPTSKPRFVGEKVKLGELLLNTFSGEWGTEEGVLLTPVLRTSNFNEDGSLNYSTPAMRCISEGKVEKKRMVRGDIILEKSGGTPKRPVGIMAFYDSDALALCSNFNQVLRFDKGRILPRFAFHQLRWLKDRNAFDRYTRKTTGLQNLQMKKLIELKLRVPRIEVQTSIATTLDEIVGDQRTLQQEIADLDSLVKSRFVEMFASGGFPTVSFGDACLRVNNGITRRGNDPDGDIVLRLVELQEGFIDYAKPNRIRLTQKEKERFSLVDGDLLFARVNGNPKSVGRCASFSAINESVYHNDHVIRATFDHSKYNPEFLVFFMNSSKGRAQIKAAITTSAGQYTINQAGIKSIQVPLPPLTLQQEFAAFVSQVDKSRFIAKQQIEKLQMLYDSLAQDYFGD